MDFLLLISTNLLCICKYNNKGFGKMYYLVFVMKKDQYANKL